MIWEDSIPGKIGFNSEDSLEQDASEFDKKEIHYRLEKLGVRMHKSTYERINDYDFDERLNSIFIFYEYSNSDEPKYLMLRGHQTVDIKRLVQNQKPASYFHNLLDKYEKIKRIVDNSDSAFNTTLDQQILSLNL